MSFVYFWLQCMVSLPISTNPLYVREVGSLPVTKVPNVFSGLSFDFVSMLFLLTFVHVEFILFSYLFCNRVFSPIFFDLWILHHN